MEGRWIIVGSDVSTGNIRMLQDGEQVIGGRSLRKNLSQEQRLLLHGRLEAAALRGRAFDEVCSLEGRDYYVRVLPVRTPQSRTPVGAVGGYVREGHEFPPMPLIGALEWHLDVPSGERTILWDDAMRRLYRLRPEQLRQVRDDPLVWSPSEEWLTGWIEPVDQDRLQRLITSATHQVVPDVAVLSYGLRMGGNARVTVELAATSMRRGDASLAFVGMVREVPVHTKDVIPATLPKPTPRMDALIELTADIPLAQVDSRTGEPVQVMPGWEAAGLPNLGKHPLPSIIPADRRGELRAALGHSEDGQVRVVEDLVMPTRGGPLRVDLWIKTLGDGRAMIRLVRR